ncbi:sodium:proton antiporter [Idiomarina sp. M1R2S28]|uniref:Sodium:proton antiporter n=1 Tax=Idiomarina rhizosphaerae TaxID=2961572 RepID=A0A9X2JU01_9GAMM|nr:Na+/H+ antiporter NhaC family protein [Idiomarina rhizosphaerae]MCP1338521.1 sodium:proton antiporter [Idiomarina rhizosphaerae]
MNKPPLVLPAAVYCFNLPVSDTYKCTQMELSWTSLLPSLLAIVFAIVTRKVLLALIGGIILANILLFWPAPANIAYGTLESTWDTLIDPSNMLVWFFTLGIGALFGVLENGGTFKQFVLKLEKKQWIESKRRARLMTWILGVVVFIESNVTIMISGTTSRPIYDRLGIAREKLAYIVDSTCAAICILIPLNAWGAFNLTLISNQGVEQPLLVFIQSIAFNFYAIFAVLLALFVALFDWNIGPMKAFEKNAVPDQVSQNTWGDGPDEETSFGKGMAVVMTSLIALVVMVPVMLLVTGNGVLVDGNGTLSVFIAIYVALGIAVAGTLMTQPVGLVDVGKYLLKGAWNILPLAVILWLSIALGGLTRDLGTGEFLAAALDGSVALWMLLPLIFVLSAITGFSIGSSWGTFAIMLPLAIPLAMTLGLPPAPFIAAAISGGIFGDHASPISDTTIIASMASGVEHIDHVRTQLPYALVAGLAATVAYAITGMLI